MLSAEDRSNGVGENKDRHTRSGLGDQLPAFCCLSPLQPTHFLAHDEWKPQSLLAELWPLSGSPGGAEPHNLILNANPLAWIVESIIATWLVAFHSVNTDLKPTSRWQASCFLKWRLKWQWRLLFCINRFRLCICSLYFRKRPSNELVERAF